MNQPESPQDLLHLQHILTRDLDALAQEVEATPDGLLWQGAPGFPNAVGTLAFHLCGNLRHFIGHEIGGDHFVRDRDAEFSGTPLSKVTLLAEIQATKDVVDSPCPRSRGHPRRPLVAGLPGFPNSVGTLPFTSAATCATSSGTK